VGNVLSWVQRYAQWVPITRIEIEYVKFDLQKLQDPEIAGVEYQQGELQGYEVREYLLEKWGRKCAYCGAENVPLCVEHLRAKARGGTDRLSNLALACLDCNKAKGDQDIREFLADRLDLLRRILAQAQAPLKDASAVNVARRFILRGLQALGFAVTCRSGGRTKWNRSRLGLPKTHALDALCVGEVAKVSGAGGPVLRIRAIGRGVRCRTNVDAHGFPRGYRMRCKRVYGFQTGDLVQAEVPCGKHAGVHVGRVTVRRNGSFRVGKVGSLSWRHCRLLQRADGYEYAWKAELDK
jgi:5-methylcytosine-specific restriction endonuclease McrA